MLGSGVPLPCRAGTIPAAAPETFVLRFPWKRGIFFSPKLSRLRGWQRAGAGTGSKRPSRTPSTAVPFGGGCWCPGATQRCTPCCRCWGCVAAELGSAQAPLCHGHAAWCGGFLPSAHRDGPRGRRGPEEEEHLPLSVPLRSLSGGNKQPAGKITWQSKRRALAPAPAIAVARAPAGDGHAGGASSAFGSGWEGHLGSDSRPIHQQSGAFGTLLASADAGSDERQSLCHPPAPGGAAAAAVGARGRSPHSRGSLPVEARGCPDLPVSWWERVARHQAPALGPLKCCRLCSRSFSMG